jgi:hypothetical protein
MLTADTITNEQIRQLLRVERRAFNKERDYKARMEIYKRVSEAAIALDPLYSDVARHKARARCAEILNARVTLDDCVPTGARKTKGSSDA